MQAHTGTSRGHVYDPISPSEQGGPGTAGHGLSGIGGVHQNGIGSYQDATIEGGATF